MSMNQYMHPRNIYKQPPNFKQLALEYPEFRKYVTQDVSGKIIIDFKNVEALRALTCTLLKKDFGLDIEIPLNKLIPTVPLRLNYILWLEDLLNLAGRTLDVKGIDIGTGASCIYPLLAAKKMKWSMIATEIDKSSIECATKNITRNNLDTLIKIMCASGASLLTEVLEKHLDSYDFCMCNPPFFASVQELHPSFRARKLDRPRPKNAFCASVDEVVSKGGEVEYVTKLINESKTLGKAIKIYSTMLGQKNSLPPLKKLIREIAVVSFKQTEFCQGHTTRWGLAWTFCDIDLTKIPDSLVAAKQKQPKPLIYEVPKLGESDYKVGFISDKLVEMFKRLQIHCQEVKRVKNLIEHVIVAYADTWSHQRRKRREKSKSGEYQSEANVDTTCDQLADLNVKIGETQKRSLDEDACCGTKKIKTDLDECIYEKIYLKAKISVVKIGELVVLELMFFEGSGTKEALHQILQYIKNNLAQKES